MIYAVIDTNVLVAALLSKHRDSATVQVVMHMLAGKITPIYSNTMLAEYRDVLQRKKFKFPQEDQDYLISAIEKYGKHVSPSTTKVKLPDEKDLPFYEAAIVEKAYYLVTGNIKHFPEKDFILTPREFLTILQDATVTT